jgi:hypothetical protein
LERFRDTRRSLRRVHAFGWGQALQLEFPLSSPEHTPDRHWKQWCVSRVFLANDMVRIAWRTSPRLKSIGRNGNGKRSAMATPLLTPETGSCAPMGTGGWPNPSGFIYRGPLRPGLGVRGN